MNGRKITESNIKFYPSVSWIGFFKSLSTISIKIKICEIFHSIGAKFYSRCASLIGEKFRHPVFVAQQKETKAKAL